MQIKWTRKQNNKKTKKRKKNIKPQKPTSAKGEEPRWVQLKQCRRRRHCGRLPIVLTLTLIYSQCRMFPASSTSSLCPRQETTFSDPISFVGGGGRRGPGSCPLLLGQPQGPLRLTKGPRARAGLRLGFLVLFFFKGFLLCECVSARPSPRQCYAGAWGSPSCLLPLLRPPLCHQPSLWTRQRADGAGGGLRWPGPVHRSTGPFSGCHHCPAPF